MTESTPDLATIVDEWWDWATVSDALGIPVSKVRQLIKDNQLASAVPVAGKGERVPAAFILDGEIVKGVSGILTVLNDGGYDSRQAITWLFTADDSIPGRPIDALRENRGSEVKRRAQSWPSDRPPAGVENSRCVASTRSACRVAFASSRMRRLVDAQSAASLARCVMRDSTSARAPDRSMISA